MIGVDKDQASDVVAVSREGDELIDEYTSPGMPDKDERIGDGSVLDKVSKILRDVLSCWWMWGNIGVAITSAVISIAAHRRRKLSNHRCPIQAATCDTRNEDNHRIVCTTGFRTVRVKREGASAIDSYQCWSRVCGDHVIVVLLRACWLGILVLLRDAMQSSDGMADGT
jgi:hypothetical protein